MFNCSYTFFWIVIKCLRERFILHHFFSSLKIKKKFRHFKFQCYKIESQISLNKGLTPNKKQSPKWGIIMNNSQKQNKSTKKQLLVTISICRSSPLRQPQSRPVIWLNTAHAREPGSPFWGPVIMDPLFLATV